MTIIAGGAQFDAPAAFQAGNTVTDRVLNQRLDKKGGDGDISAGRVDIHGRQPNPDGPPAGREPGHSLETASGE